MPAGFAGGRGDRVAILRCVSLCVGVEHSNNKRKVLAAVLVIGAGAIAVDQLILGGVSSPESAAAADAVAIAPTAAAVSAAAPAWQDSTQGLSARLARLAGEGDARVPEGLNAFRAPGDWFAQPVVAEAAAEVQPAAPTISADQFKVGAVMTGASAMATINGHTLRPGESKAGITLIEVRELDGVATVVFEFEGARLEFTPTAPQQRP